MHKLEVDSLYYRFKGKDLLSGLYLMLESNTVTGMLGRNGCGKSTFMNILFGTLKPAQGSIRYNDVRVARTYVVPGLISYLPQHSFIPKTFRINEVFIHFDQSFDLFLSYFPRFEHLYHERIEDLSGGEVRLVEIFIILNSSSKFVILDEPFSNLSPVIVESIKMLINDVKADKGILITDHLYYDVLEVSDKMYVFREATLHDVRNEEDLQRAGYLQDR